MDDTEVGQGSGGRKEETVPFGKYRGRPVADMLADTEYMAWLEAQPWFRERFSRLLANRDADAASRTPVHNRLQALFLDSSYCGAFVECAMPAQFRTAIDDGNASKLDAATTAQKFCGDLEDTLKRLRGNAESGNALKYVIEGIRDADERLQAAYSSLHEYVGSWASPRRSAQASFEVDGCDVLILWIVEWKVLASPYGQYQPKLTAGQTDRKGTLRVEIKPTVADEYPAVLRQMVRNKSDYLFVDQYAGEGATEEQFVAIFKASGKRVIFKRDVDAAVRRPA